MKERNRASEQLSVQGDDPAADPDNYKNDPEHQPAAVFSLDVGGQGQGHREHQTEQQRAPEVPVPEFSRLFLV